MFKITFYKAVSLDPGSHCFLDMTFPDLCVLAGPP